MTTDPSPRTDTSQVGVLLDKFLDPFLWVVTARAGSHRGGLVATFVHKASLVPQFLRLVVGIAQQHHTWKLIESSRSFAVHLVTEDRIDWIERFGLCSGRSGCDKFDGLSVSDGLAASPLLVDAMLWMDCRVETSMDTGDRTVYLVEVAAAGSGRPGEPLRLSRLLSLLRAEQRVELNRLLARDIGIDSAAISAWRARESAATSS